MNKSTTIVGVIMTPILVTDRSSRQKLIKNIVDLKSIINQSDLTDVYGIFHSTATNCTYPSSSHGIFTKCAIFWAVKHTLSNLEG